MLGGMRGNHEILPGRRIFPKFVLPPPLLNPFFNVIKKMILAFVLTAIANIIPNLLTNLVRSIIAKIKKFVNRKNST